MLGADLVFNALHGGDGENGSVQAFLDMHHISYTGSGAKACKIAMDKNITKLIARSVNIPTPNWIMLRRDQYTGMKLQENKSLRFSYPFVVKPSNEGSTFGLSIVNEESKLDEAINLAADFSDEIIIEEFIPDEELMIEEYEHEESEAVLEEVEKTASSSLDEEEELVEEMSEPSGDFETLRIPLNRLLTSLGVLGVKEILGSDEIERVRFAIASKVGITPRDSRVDRLLKLALRLIPREVDENLRKRAGMISMLAGCADNLNEWAALRLRSRNDKVGEGLLQNSWNLGKALERIPGPGVALPLEQDDYQLPAADELNELATEVAKLSKFSNLGGTTGIKAL